jgi:hypothetical protein
VFIRRILLVMTVAAVMAAMMVVMAGAAFAKPSPGPNPGLGNSGGAVFQNAGTCFAGANAGIIHNGLIIQERPPGTQADEARDQHRRCGPENFPR